MSMRQTAIAVLTSSAAALLSICLFCKESPAAAGEDAQAKRRAPSGRASQATPAVLAEAGKPPLCISGVYPHLAALGGEDNEFGIGVLVPWAGKLWMKTYRAGGQGNLYSIDDALTLRLEGSGDGLGNRLVHRETKQLFIAHCAIDAQGKVQNIKALPGRPTAAMRHLTDPANKIYIFGMEGRFFEIDAHTLAGKELFVVRAKGVTGAHGKGGYTGQGRVVVANNGGAGGLAEWDGNPEHSWNLLERKQFCEVTGPGGIYGAATDDDPLWTTGWDERSVILKVCDKGVWHDYRLPKASYSYDSENGWFTEWPRIRETLPGKYMIDMHGMYYEMPGGFRPGRAGGLTPIASHARMTVDWCLWKDQLVLSHDDTTGFNNPLCGQAQSNLTFLDPKDLRRFGPPAGWGGPWVGDAVKAGDASDPYLIAGFAKRVVHLAHTADVEVNFAIEIDADGSGKWTAYKTITVPAKGYAYHIFPRDLKAQWVRLKTDKDCQATAYFHYSGESDRPASSIAVGLAGTEDGAAPQPRIEGAVIPFYSPEGLLHFAARAVGADGKAVDLGLYEVDREVRIVAAAAGKTIDPKTAMVKQPQYGSALPWFSAGSPYAKAAAAGWASRTLREVVTERNMLNFEGTIYDVPRSGIRRARPITTHGKLFSDFCSWRGLFVVAGARPDAAGDGHVFKSADGKAALWFGQIEDLWRMGKPRGVGGPWRQTALAADKPSPEYMMTGFDRKKVDLSHDAAEEVTFAIEVDFLAATKGTSWHRLIEIKVPAGMTVTHVFPDGYSAHWVRVKADKPCAATAWFVYE